MEMDLVKYTEFYKRKHQGHKLDWDHSLGIATLRARFNGGEKELSVSLHQAVILLLFNDESEMPYKDIKKAIPLGASFALILGLSLRSCGHRGFRAEENTAKSGMW